MENQCQGTYKNIQAATFKQNRYRAIERILIHKDSHSSFFYPKYHFGEYRCCWGNYVSFWGEGTIELENRLRSISSRFSQGASISIYFSLGFALVLKEAEEYCIRFERDYGYGTSIADANKNFATLRELFIFFKKMRSTKECINWGLENIDSFGHWDTKDENIFIPYTNNFSTYICEFRNFTRREIEFIGNKLNRQNYCQDMRKPAYYYSDVYTLLNTIEDGDIGSNILIL